MNTELITNIALIVLDAALLCTASYNIGFMIGWRGGRRELKDTISACLDSMIASGKIVVMFRKDQLEKAGIKVPEDDSEDK